MRKERLQTRSLFTSCIGIYLSIKARCACLSQWQEDGRRDEGGKHRHKEGSVLHASSPFY